MALILSIETATKVCSVAVHQKGILLGMNEIHLDNVHSQKIMGLISALLGQLNVEVEKLDAVAVSSGPGSYTGLRIGVSVAKGLAFALNIPLIDISSLDALASQVIPFCEKNSHIIPMIDARRMEVYAIVTDCDGVIVEKPSPVVIEGNPFISYLETGLVYFLGDGAEKAKEVLSHQNARFLSILNSSKSLGKIAYQKFLDSKFQDLAYFEPNYLKEFRVLSSKKNPFLT
jgi:tRNA threonylcarbamoyladenosine biosynthesis protein TsaB